jgi:hypothetical protein
MCKRSHVRREGLGRCADMDEMAHVVFSGPSKVCYKHTGLQAICDRMLETHLPSPTLDCHEEMPSTPDSAACMAAAAATTAFPPSSTTSLSSSSALRSTLQHPSWLALESVTRQHCQERQQHKLLHLQIHGSEHVRHNKSGKTHRDRARINHLRELPYHFAAVGRSPCPAELVNHRCTFGVRGDLCASMHTSRAGAHTTCVANTARNRRTQWVGRYLPSPHSSAIHIVMIKPTPWPHVNHVPGGLCHTTAP